MRKLCAGALPYLSVLICLALVGCDDDGVDSDEEARLAYLGLDDSIAKSIKLGFDGFNSASSANITPQTMDAIVAGTLTVSGQVDQGASDNKGMRLYIGMVGYDDGDVPTNEDGSETVHIVYDTDAAQLNQPYLNMMLKMIPTGTFDGMLTANSSMVGVYRMTGDIEGTLILNLTITGTLMACDAPCITLRVPMTTHVTGTATNGDGGSYTIDLTI